MEEEPSPEGVAAAAMLGLTPDARILRAGRIVPLHELSLDELTHLRDRVIAELPPEHPARQPFGLAERVQNAIEAEGEAAATATRTAPPERARTLRAGADGMVREGDVRTGREVTLESMSDAELRDVQLELQRTDNAYGLNPEEESLFRRIRTEQESRVPTTAEEDVPSARLLGRSRLDAPKQKMADELWAATHAMIGVEHLRKGQGRRLLVAEQELKRAQAANDPVGTEYWTNQVAERRAAAADPEAVRRTDIGRAILESGEDAEQAFAKYEKRYPMPEGVRAAVGALDTPERPHFVIRGRDGRIAHGFLEPPKVEGGAPEFSILASPSGRGQLGRAELRELKALLVEQFGETMRHEPPTWTHVGGAGTEAAANDWLKIQRLWPLLGAALAAEGLLDEEGQAEFAEAGVGLPITATAMAVAAGTPAARLGGVLKGLGLAGAGVAAEQLLEDEDLQATGRGAQYLGLASALWASGAPQRAWGALGDALVERARKAPHGTGITRTIIENTNPEAMLDPVVRQYVREYEDEVGRIGAQGARLGAVARELPQDLDRFVSDLVEGEDWTGDAGRQALEAKYGAEWPNMVRVAMQLAEAIREESGYQTAAKMRAGMLRPAAVEKYAVEGRPAQSKYLKRLYAAVEGPEVNPAWQVERPAAKQMRVPAETRRRSLDIPVDEARRRLDEAEARLADFESRRADEPQPTDAELDAARREASDAQEALDKAKAEQMATRRGLGEIREASYRVPEQAEEAARQIAGADLFHKLSQLDQFAPPDRKLLHPDWLSAARERIAAREAEAWAMDVEAQANARQVREYIETSLERTRQKLASLDARIAEDTAAGKPTSDSARRRRRDLANQARRAQESLPYWREMEQAKTDKPALELAQQRVRDAEQAMGNVRKRHAVAGAKPEAGQHWVSLPESGFGAMSGAVVTQDLQQSLQGILTSARQSPLERFLRWWKRQKTVYSPGTHVGNTMSNVVMSHMAGLPVYELLPWMRKAAKAMDEVRGGKSARLSPAGEMALQLRGMGVLGSLTEAEGTRPPQQGRRGRLAGLMAEAEPRVAELLEQANVAPKPSWLGRVSPTAEAASKWATNLYQAEDDIFRVAMALWRQSKGDTPEQAAQYARRNLVDYRTRSPALRGLASTGVAPFVLYPAKALPTFAQHVLENPERWVTLMAPFAGLNEWAQANAPAGDVITAQDIPPEQRRPSWAGYLMPGMTQLGAFGRETPLGYERIGINPSRWFPTSSLVDRPPPELGYRGVLPDWWPRLLTPSGPTFEMPATFLANRDPFTGRPIVPPGAGAAEKAGRIALRMGRNLLSPTVGIGERIATNVQEGRPAAHTAGEALMQSLGLRPNVIEPGRFADRAMITLDEDRTVRLSEARRSIRRAAADDREAARGEVMASTEAALERLRQGILDELELTGEARDELEGALLARDQEALSNLEAYDPDNPPRESAAEQSLQMVLEKLRKARAAR
jgi:hypothetical protein